MTNKQIANKKYSQSSKGKIARAKAWKKYASKPEVKEHRKQLRKKLIHREYKEKQLRKVFDPIFKLTCSLRGRLNTFLRTNKLEKKCKFNDYIGCTKYELITSIESKFQEGMSWNNHGEWEIDHIIPLSSAKSEQEIYNLCHYSNLQPLWAKDNRSKGNRIR